MSNYDFQKPVPGDLYADDPDAILKQIRNATDSIAKWLDGTSDENVPDGAYRLNSGQSHRIEKWDDANSTWTAVTIGLGALVSELTGLTSGEVNQLQKINNVTINNTQWGYVGGLDQALSSGDSVDFAGITQGGTSVVLFTRSLTGGDGIQSIGDLSQDRTIAIDTSRVAVLGSNVFPNLQSVENTEGIANGYKIQGTSAGAHDFRWAQKSTTRWAFTDETDAKELFEYDASVGDVNFIQTATQNGNAILDASKLAPTGGIPQTDRENTYTSKQEMSLSSSTDFAWRLKNDGFVGVALESYRSNTADHCIYNAYAARGTKSSPADLNTGDYVLTIAPRARENGSFVILDRMFAQYEGSGRAGWFIGGAGSQGAGTFNVPQLYDGSNRVARDATVSSTTNVTGSRSTDTWYTNNSGKEMVVVLEGTAETDGSGGGAGVGLRVDLSGGTSQDFTLQAAEADDALGAWKNTGTVTYALPPGASYEIFSANNSQSFPIKAVIEIVK